MRKRVVIFFLFFSFLFILSCNEKKVLRMVTTTSLENCGLFDVLVPEFEKKSGIKVHYQAVGTGQAVRLAKDGTCDLLFIHDKEAEEQFMKLGYGKERYEIMQNYFIYLCPPQFKEILNGKDYCFILQYISENNLPFVSRGDESGTHLKEKKLWKECKIEKMTDNYFESGSNMVTTLRIAAEKGYFTFSDSATYFSHKKELNLEICSEKSPKLSNIYSIILMNPQKFSSTKTKEAKKFVNFLTKGEGKDILINYGREKYGFPLFEPSASVEEEN